MDLSERLEPGQPWALSILLNESSSSDSSFPGQSSYFLLLREMEEDLFTGLSQHGDVQPISQTLDVGSTYSFMLEPTVGGGGDLLHLTLLAASLCRLWSTCLSATPRAP